MVRVRSGRGSVSHPAHRIGLTVRNPLLPKQIRTWKAALQEHWRRCIAPRAARELRLCESLALGEKRFVAIVAVGSQRYLVGGTASTLSLLSELQANSGERTL
jgi:hypothetical protein